MKKIVFATNNAHKLSEIRQILGERIEVLSLNDIGCHADIPETADTLKGNALQKAEYVASHYHIDCFADDTGLEVDALGGAPGVHSARYAGIHGDDAANNRLLLTKLEGAESRKAHYVCAIALARPDGSVVTAEGYLYGEIGFEEKGENGFGYDPLFLLPDYGCTAAEISPEEKNAISHRANALKELLAKLEK